MGWYKRDVDEMEQLIKAEFPSVECSRWDYGFALHAGDLVVMQPKREENEQEEIRLTIDDVRRELAKRRGDWD